VSELGDSLLRRRRRAAPLVPPLDRRFRLRAWAWGPGAPATPRRPRFALTDFALHIVQQGSDRQPCFSSEADYLVYLQALHAFGSRIEAIASRATRGGRPGPRGLHTHGVAGAITAL